MTTPQARPLRASDPERLGDYTLLGRLGEGGMGSVYLGRSAQGQIVAVKAIRRDLADDPGFRRRFRSEVDRARQVPAFCTAEVLDADPDHDPPYLVVEYVDGPSLSQVVESRGPLTEANLHGLAIAVATALTGIHGAGVIHRDLKPSNVLLSFGSAKVIDFGIARSADLVETNATDPHQLIGTVPYMAPERLSPDASQTLTAAADIFAWAAVVTFAGTGRTPFGGGGVEAAARILLHSPDLTGLKGPLRDLVEKALSKDPADRPTARELLDRLLSTDASTREPGLIEAASKEAVVTVPSGGDVTRAVPPASATLAATPRRPRRRALAVVAGVLVLASAVAAAVLTDGFGHLAGSSVTPSTSPSASTAASPSPSPSPSAIPLVRDALAADGVFWKYRRDPKGIATCRLSGALIVTLTTGGTYRCPGYGDPLTDFTISVDVGPKTADTCGGIWLRFNGVRGYLLAVCRDRFELWEHGEKLIRVRTWALPPPVAAPARLRATVIMQGAAMTFLSDGVAVGSIQRTTYKEGRVVLGIYVPSGAKAKPPYEVEFADIEIVQPSQ